MKEAQRRADLEEFTFLNMGLMAFSICMCNGNDISTTTSLLLSKI
jgi:hypothetical protein